MAPLSEVRSELKLGQRLTALKNLPPFAPVAAKLMILLSRDDVNFKDAADLIKADAAIAAEILRLANSPMSGLRYPPTSVLQMISVLGIKRVASLTATLSMGKLVKPVSKLPVMRRIWRHNLATALTAQKWAPEYKVDPDSAYLFGLLSGIGRLGLLVLDPDRYSKIIERAETDKAPLDVLEEIEFGFTNRDAGAWLVGQWHLPPEMADIFAENRGSGLNDDLVLLIREAASEASRIGFGILAAEGSEASENAAFDLATRLNQIEQELAI